MATTKATAKKKSSSTTKATKPIVKEEKVPVFTDTNTDKPATTKDIDLRQFVVVRNGFQGKLVYSSPKTGERFVWDEFGSEQEMELIELRAAKNSHKKFFENNWFMFDEDWVVDFLGVKQYYKHAIRIEDFDNIFALTPDKMRETVKALSKGQKKSVAYRAKVLIDDGTIDSKKAISALEEALGIELIEK